MPACSHVLVYHTRGQWTDVMPLSVWACAIRSSFVHRTFKQWQRKVKPWRFDMETIHTNLEVETSPCIDFESNRDLCVRFGILAVEFCYFMLTCWQTGSSGANAHPLGDHKNTCRGGDWPRLRCSSGEHSKEHNLRCRSVGPSAICARLHYLSFCQKTFVCLPTWKNAVTHLVQPPGSGWYTLIKLGQYAAAWCSSKIKADTKTS